jgi:hypothetical protein
MPFSRDDFFNVFASYNDSVWPAQILLYVLAAGAVVCLISRTSAGIRGAYAILAILWIWMGVVYHAVFFAPINPIALVFGGVFVIQAMIFAWIAVRRQMTGISQFRKMSLAGWTLIAFSMAGYPLFSFVASHNYPAQPTFGLPCPTTIFTLGIILVASGRVPRIVYVIPMAWAVIGSFAAFNIGVVEDISLLFALGITLSAVGSRLPGRKMSGARTKVGAR